LTCQKFNKLAAIYRLCAALEVDPTDVLPGITAACDKVSPEVVKNQDEKLPDVIKEERKEFADDIDGGS
jgi:hypothetical protein